MGAHEHPVLDEDDLNEADTAILNELHQGRGTPKFLATRLQTDRSYVSQRLKRLQEHTHVTKLETGLYELTHDPRDEPPDEPNQPPDRVQELEAHLEECREELQAARNEADTTRDGVDYALVEKARDAAHDAENELPEGAPGRTSIETTIKLLNEALKHD